MFNKETKKAEIMEVTHTHTMSNREKLIQEIWSYCKNTHNSTDYEDLQTFNVKELKKILTDIK